jgi:hypothetical protein
MYTPEEPRRGRHVPASRSSVPEPLRRLAVKTAERAGRLTARHRVLPSFLIAGGQRCGTTSMYKALIQHPLVMGPVLRKGVHYFDMHYDEPLSSYRSHFPLQATVSRRSRGDQHAVAFESSPYYLYHPLAAQRIAKDLPDVRLLILVRDPVERAYSAHSHELARGFEDVVDFATALDLEPERLRGEEERLSANPHATSASFRHHAYVQRGQYVDHLSRLAAAIGRERIHVIDSHAFFEDPLPIYDRVLDFLGLPHGASPAFDQHNARSRSTLSEDLREKLRVHFEPYDRELESWLGTTPSWRRDDVGDHL